jgi:hypothetical protein
VTTPLSAVPDPPKQGPAPRVILCQLGLKPRVTSIDAGIDGGYASTLELMFGVPARIPLHEGVELYCDRESLLFGLALVRRALAMAIAEPWRPEVKLRLDRSALNRDEWLGDPDLWSVGGDFMLARVADDGKLVGLTDADVQLWMFWLGFDYIMNR